jgi:hypothetical protein
MDTGEPVISVHNSRQSASSELGGGNGEGTGGEGTSHGLGTSGVASSSIISGGLSPSCSGPGGVILDGSISRGDQLAWVNTFHSIFSQRDLDNLCVGVNRGRLSSIAGTSISLLNIWVKKVMDLLFNASRKEKCNTIGGISIAGVKLLCSEKGKWGICFSFNIGCCACIISVNLEGISLHANSTCNWGCEFPYFSSGFGHFFKTFLIN